MFPTDEEIMLALCCGGSCEGGDGVCHRLDFASEANRIRALLDRWDFADEAKRVRALLDAVELMQ